MPLFKHPHNLSGPWWADISMPGLSRIRKSLKTTDREEAERRYLKLERAAWEQSVKDAAKKAKMQGGGPHPQRAARKRAPKALPHEPKEDPTPRPLATLARAGPVNSLRAPEASKLVTLQKVYERAIQTHYADKKDLSGVVYRWNTLTRFLDPGTDVTTITRAKARDVQLLMKGTLWDHRSKGNFKPYSMASINRVLALLGKLLVFAHEEMDVVMTVPRMPKFDEGRKFKRRPMTREEYEKALTALESHENQRWKDCADFLRVLWGTGCRLGEVMPSALTWPQVDFAQRALYWDDSKSGHPMGLPMTQEVYDILKAKRETGLKAPFSNISLHVFREAWDWIRESVLGITDPQERSKLVPHSIRHAAATRVLKAGHSASKAQRLLGHKTYQTTQRYEHLDVEDLRDAAEALK